MAELETMLLDAAKADQRVEDIATLAFDRKRRDYRDFVALLFPDEVRRPDIDQEEITDILLAIDSATVVSTLIDRMGWTYDRYQHWLETTMTRLFLTTSTITD